MMKIKILRPVMVGNKVIAEGDEVEASAPEAKVLIEKGLAEAVTTRRKGK